MAQKVGFPADTEFLVFEQSSSTFMKKILAEGSFERGWGCVSLIFQLPPGTPLPATDFPWAVGAPASGDESSLPRAVHLTEASTVEEFCSKTVDAIVYLFEDQALPVRKVSFSPAISLANFKLFLARTLGLDYDPAANAILIYKKDYHEMRPGTTELKDDPRYGLGYEFSGAATTDFHIWARFIPDMPEAKVAQLQELTVEAGTVNKFQPERCKLFVPKSTQIRGVLERLVANGFVPASNDLRFFKTHSAKIEKEAALDDVVMPYESTLFVAQIPTLADTQVLLRVCHVSNDQTYLRGFLAPFLLVVDRGDRVQDVIDRLKSELGIEEKAFQRLRFLIGGQHAGMNYDSALLKGEWTWGEAIEAAKLKADAWFYIIYPPNAKTTRYREQAVKIYN
jgi:hypothetical protein